MRRHAPTLMLLAAAILNLSCGCSVCGRSRHVTYFEDKNLVFNPQFIRGAHPANARAEWPSTVARDQTRDEVEYRETIIDRQSSYGRTDDYLYRRFDSVRTGRSNR